MGYRARYKSRNSIGCPRCEHSTANERALLTCVPLQEAEITTLNVSLESRNLSFAGRATGLLAHGARGFSRISNALPMRRGALRPHGT
jgi:hypothetical protein